MSRMRADREGASRGEISSQRKNLYTTGIVLSVLGLLVFFGAFIYGMAGGPKDAAPEPGSPDFGRRMHENFEASKSHGTTMMVIALVAILLLIVGQWLRRLGARGLAGSGLVLDPKRARKDLEPWSRMAGGMAEDALSEVGTVQKIANRQGAAPTVQVRCRSCKALNAETAKFCDQCGQAL